MGSNPTCRIAVKFAKKKILQLAISMETGFYEDGWALAFGAFPEKKFIPIFSVFFISLPSVGSTRQKTLPSVRHPALGKGALCRIELCRPLCWVWHSAKPLLSANVVFAECPKHSAKDRPAVVVVIWLSMNTKDLFGYKAFLEF